MATNTIQIKRTSVSGRTANSTTLPNPGELALNMTDGIMYSTNGSVVFEIGANNTNQRVSGILTVNAISANGGVGTAGQVLSSNGTSAYWATSSTLNAQQTVYTYTLAANTTVISGASDQTTTLGYVAGLENVFINGVRQISGVDYNTTNATAITLTSNAIAGEVVQVVAWTGSINSTNVNAQFAWTNTQSFSNTITFGAISANGSLGTAGQVLHSNGTAVYWAVDDNSGGTVTSIATSNGISGGTITSTGTIGVATGSTLTVNTTGIHVNSALSITSLTLAGALSGITTLAAGNTTITGFANVSTTLQVGTNTATFGTAAYIVANGNVGINTSTPATNLEVNGGLIAGSENRQTHPSTGPVGFKAQWNFTGGDGETDLYNLYSVATTSFRFYQTTGSGTAQLLYNMRPSSHEFYTGGTERVRIDSSGNVGIGTSSPAAKLHANGTVNFTGALTSGDLADAVGYKGLPQNQRTSAYTLTLADMGKHIYATAGAFAVTIPANATTAFPIGTAITIIVEDAGKTVVPASGVTLVLAGTGGATTGTRTVAIGSVVTCIKVGTNRWFISGAGVT